MTDISPALRRLLEEAGPSGIRSLNHLADLIYRQRFSGPTTIHWYQGRPRQIDFGAPIRLSIMEGGLDSKATYRQP
jgi:hypothetical protein